MASKKKIDINECIFEKEYIEVVPYQVNIKCPKCKIGNLVNNPSKVGTVDSDIYFMHYCDNPNCKNFENIKNNSYPRIEYIRKESLNKERKI